MTVMELNTYIINEKKWIATRLSTIDKLLDRAAYGKSSNDDELIEESELLEQKTQKLDDASTLIDKAVRLEQTISLLETGIDALSCYPRNQSKIDDLYKEIASYEQERDELIEKVKKILEIKNDSRSQSNKK